MFEQPSLITLELFYLSCRKDNYNQNPGVNKDAQNQRTFTSTVINNKLETTRTPLKTGSEIRCTGRVSISCTVYGTSRVISLFSLVMMEGNYDWGWISDMILLCYAFIMLSQTKIRHAHAYTLSPRMRT